MLFRRSTENEWNIIPEFHDFPCYNNINTMATQRGRYITFFKLVDDISCRQVIFHAGR